MYSKRRQIILQYKLNIVRNLNTFLYLHNTQYQYRY
jgi:hypothetical protein